jgi:hypothetical protein
MRLFVSSRKINSITIKKEILTFNYKKELLVAGLHVENYIF